MAPDAQAELEVPGHFSVVDGSAQSGLGQPAVATCGVSPGGAPVTPQLRPTVRFGQLSDWKDRDQLALGLTYYPASSVAIKGEYDLRSGDKKNDEIWLQTAVKW